MAPRPQLNGISLCAGAGMLDEGLRAGLDYLGCDYRTVCHVEREAYAAAILAARMQEGVLDPAPVWSDLTTFDARRWRRRVHFLTAGFPCQPHSVAGKREGTADERWIWPAIAERISEAQPAFCWLENVPGLVSSGGLEACLFDLARLGFDAQVGSISAAAVGASHERKRIFILAYRRCEHFVLLERSIRREHQAESLELDAGAELANAIGSRYNRRKDESERVEVWRTAAEGASAELGNAESNGRRERRTELPRQPGRSDSGGTSCELADTDIERRQLSSAGRLATVEQSGTGSATFLFAPGPLDERWPAIIADQPHLAPATEPGFRVLVDGVAWLVDEHRADQLRAVGNGVVPLQAAVAFVSLARRAGIA